MKLFSLIPMIWTDRIEETINFYTQIPGFSIGEINDDWGWASLFRDEVEIMISKPIVHSDFSKPVFTGSFYSRTNEVEQLWNELKDKVRICYPLESFDWGMREFAVYGNNGYILQFGEEIAGEKFRKSDSC